MPAKKRPTEPAFAPAYLNVADLAYGFTGFEVRAAWIVRYAPDDQIRRYLKDAIRRFDADMGRFQRRVEDDDPTDDDD